MTAFLVSMAPPIAPSRLASNNPEYGYTGMVLVRFRRLNQHLLPKELTADRRYTADEARWGPLGVM